VLLPSLERRLTNLEERALIIERLTTAEIWKLWNWYLDDEQGNHGVDLTTSNLFVDALIIEGYAEHNRQYGSLCAFLLGLSGTGTLLDSEGENSPFPVSLTLQDVFDAMEDFELTGEGENCGYPCGIPIMESPGIAPAITGWRTLMLVLAASCNLPAPDETRLLLPDRMRFPFFIGVQACGVDVIGYRGEVGDCIF